MESDFVKISAILINLVSNSAAELLPIFSFPLNSEELMYFQIDIYFFLLLSNKLVSSGWGRCQINSDCTTLNCNSNGACVCKMLYLFKY